MKEITELKNKLESLKQEYLDINNELDKKLKEKYKKKYEKYFDNYYYYPFEDTYILFKDINAIEDDVINVIVDSFAYTDNSDIDSNRNPEYLDISRNSILELSTERLERCIKTLKKITKQEYDDKLEELIKKIR